MFCVYGASIEHPSTEIIKRAIDEGVIDDRGERLELIEVQSLVNLGNGTSSHNFEDTIITAEEGDFVVSHRPGRMMWERQRYGKPKAVLAKTKKNCESLAAMFYDKSFKILNPVIESEIKAIADKMIESLSPAEKEMYLKQVQGKHTKGYAGGAVRSDGAKMMEPEPLIDQKGKTIDQLASTAEDVNLNREKARLQKWEEDLKQRESGLMEKTTKKISLGGTVSKHTQVSLSEQKVFSLRKIARTEFGIQCPETSKKDWLVEKILAAQQVREVEITDKMKEQPLEVTG
jgi:hypothetical protein